MQAGLISDEERAELLRLGAVGDMLFNFYDAEGRLLDHPVNRRTMSLPISQLRSVPLRVIASGGNEKVESLLGAIRLADCNVLVTNEATARDACRLAANKLGLRTRFISRVGAH